MTEADDERDDRLAVWPNNEAEEAFGVLAGWTRCRICGQLAKPWVDEYWGWWKQHCWSCAREKWQRAVDRASADAKSDYQKMLAMIDKLKPHD